MIDTTLLRNAFAELLNKDEAKLQLALDRAYATISRYVQTPVTGVAANNALDNIALSLARAYVNDTNALGDEHPVVRDSKEALNWLSLVATGKAFLPKDADNSASTDTTSTGGGLVVASSGKAFSDSLLSLMP